MDLNYYDDLPDGQRTKVESTDIYLAKPGQRLLGALNGVDQSSANLEINLNNTDVLEFTLNRIVDGEISSWYDFVERHYELYVPKYGWFKINEEPEVTNDGSLETKTVRAESLEIEL